MEYKSTQNPFPTFSSLTPNKMFYFQNLKFKAQTPKVKLEVKYQVPKFGPLKITQATRHVSKNKKCEKRDIGWEHGEMIDNNHKLAKCKYCGKEMKGLGVSRLKEHIAGGSSNVPGCEKCPVEISRSMRDHLKSKKQVNEEVKQTQAAVRDTLMDPIRRKYGLVSDSDDDECNGEDILMMEKEHLNIALKRSIKDTHGNTISSRSQRRKLDIIWGKNKTLVNLSEDDYDFDGPSMSLVEERDENIRDKVNTLSDSDDTHGDKSDFHERIDLSNVSTSPKSLFFTEEQDFEYCTQDQNHGSRLINR